MSRFMRRFSVSADGISFVELLVAVAILSVISVATIKLIGTTDKELLQSQLEWRENLWTLP